MTADNGSRIERLRVLSVTLLAALLALTLLWEWVLAPLRPGGSWLVLKAVPLLFPLRGVLRGKVYTYRWSSMLVVFYFGEGCARVYADVPPSSWLAALEIALAIAYCAAAAAFIRAHGRAAKPHGVPSSATVR